MDKLLAEVANTDRGARATEKKKLQVRELIESLGKATQTSLPLDDQCKSSTDDDRILNSPLIFGEYDVSYTATGSKQYGEPAGGRFRGSLARYLFKTEKVRQNIYSPNIVENIVEFIIFGIFLGRVSLSGSFQKYSKNETDSINDDISSDGQVIKDCSNTIRANFEKPKIELKIGNVTIMSVRIGPSSTVVLKTTYVDERVRLGIGGRGSLFVFTRINENESRSIENVRATSQQSAQTVNQGRRTNLAMLWEVSHLSFWD